MTGNVPVACGDFSFSFSFSFLPFGFGFPERDSLSARSLSLLLFVFLHPAHHFSQPSSSGAQYCVPLVTLSVNQATHRNHTTSPRGTATELGSRERLPLLPLSMVFGGLGVMLYGGQSSLSSVERALHKVDIQSVFFATMFVIILLVLGALLSPCSSTHEK